MKLQTVFRQTKTEIALGICFSLVCAGLIWIQTEKTQIHTWLLIITTIYALRYGLVDYLSRLHSSNRNSLGNHLILLIGIIICGVAWASLIINTPFKTGDSQINLIGLGIAGILSFIVFVIYLGRMELVLSFAVASLILPILNVIDSLENHQTTMAFLFAWLVCLLFGSWRISKQLQTQPVRNIESVNEANLKLQNDRLTNQLSVTQAKVEELTNSLKLTNLDLETTQNKADALSITLNQINPFDLESGLLTEIKHKTILQREWSRMGRLELPITLVYLAIDDFEKYQEGHDKKAASMTFKRVVKIVKNTCQRPGDVFAKLKNSTIAMLLPETELEDSIELANTVCKEVEALNIKHVKNAGNEFVTVSLGIATVIPNDLLTEGEFIKRADSALYEAKFQGGNRVSHYVSHPELRLEHWDENRNGKVSADKLKKKLSTMGFETENKTYLAGGDIKDRRTHAEFAIGLLTGNFMVLIDGDTIKMKAGDILTIPKSLNILCKVKGSETVICYEGNR